MLTICQEDMSIQVMLAINAIKREQEFMQKLSKYTQLQFFINLFRHQLLCIIIDIEYQWIHFSLVACTANQCNNQIFVLDIVVLNSL